MKKIPTLFKREGAGGKLLNEINRDCEWVVRGEGVATRKFDGTCCMVKDGKLFRRREVTEAQEIPPGFIQEDSDLVTLKMIGWVPVGDGPEDKWHLEAFTIGPVRLTDGTYELTGPKIQGNPEGSVIHVLIPHGFVKYGAVPTEFNALREWLADKDIEGIVWWHPDGRKAKVKKRDFGLKRKPPESKPN